MVLARKLWRSPGYVRLRGRRDLHEIVVDELARLRTRRIHPSRGQQVERELRIPHRALDPGRRIPRARYATEQGTVFLGSSIQGIQGVPTGFTYSLISRRKKRVIPASKRMSGS